MLRNILTPQVPAVAAQHAATVLDQVLARAGVQRSQVKGWVMHPGGRDVLLALREQLGLSEHDLRWSAAVLREFGNLSSASVYFVLQAALARLRAQRLLVDVLLRRRVQLSWGAAGGGVKRE